LPPLVPGGQTSAEDDVAAVPPEASAPGAGDGGDPPAQEGGGAGEGPSGDDGAEPPADAADAPGDSSDGCAPASERCSFEDEDCDGQNNEGLDCTFLASSQDALWQVDPFTGEVTLLQEIELPGIEVLFDVAVAPGGVPYATAGRKLYRIEETGPVLALENTSDAPYAIPYNPNGLAIADDGTLFISNHDPLVGSKIVRSSSPASLPELLTSIDPYTSGGDCVINKGYLLVAADDPADSGTDVLIEVPWDGPGPILVGSMGFDNVYGLSSAFGLLFGVTHAGEVLLVDETTGAAELLHETDVAFTGAANRR
jgi:hypothetical protein